MAQRLIPVCEGLRRSDDQGTKASDLVVRLADGNLSRLPMLAIDLVEARVDAILAAGPPAVRAPRSTSDDRDRSPEDPVASALIASLGRPGGTSPDGFLDFPDFSGKCVQILLEAVPALRAIL